MHGIIIKIKQNNYTIQWCIPRHALNVTSFTILYSAKKKITILCMSHFSTLL